VTTLARWQEVWGALGAAGDPAGHAALLARYAEPHRHYHTGQHLEECLERFGAVRDRAARWAEVEVALWYHDAVYDTHRSDNEERSADLAAAALTRTPLTLDAIDRVRALILATRHEAPPATPDEALLADVDLAILAAPPARFDEYERQVREEYAWVPGILFRHKRREILRGFLARERIYTSGAFPGLEPVARANIERSLGRL
jgi:predicted metal-dependent HD superfamily phosphohydrolase